MALLEVLTFPNPFLKTRCRPVEQFNESLLQLAQDMADTMYDAPGIGLAATQVGSDLRFFIMDIQYDKEEPESKKKPLFFANPQIIETKGEIMMEEGCLSIPEFKAEVKRSDWVKVQYQDAKGNPQVLEASGLTAVCIQHELDHLNGVLFIDYLSPLRRKMIQTRLKKLARG